MMAECVYGGRNEFSLHDEFFAVVCSHIFTRGETLAIWGEVLPN